MGFKAICGSSLNGAVFSPDRTYRYLLWRVWRRNAPYVMFIGLNPSTATEIDMDPTVTRCRNYAASWGYGSIAMTNLFAYRSTDPALLYQVKDPVGPENDHYLLETATDAGLVVAAWGNHGKLHHRDEAITTMIKWLHHLGLTNQGCPKHPLYLLKDLKPHKWEDL